MRDGFIKIAAATPDLHVADCEYNAAEIVKLAKQAAANAHIIGRPDPDGNGSDGVKHRKTPFIESCRAAAPEIGQLPPAVAFSSRPSFSKSCSR